MWLWQTGAENARGGFDPNIIWQTISGMGRAFLAQLPYLIIGVIVFAGFIFAARLAKRMIKMLAARSSHIDATLGDLLGRIASALIMIFGGFVAAVIIFPSFKPNDLITGLGITSVAVGFAFKDVLQNFFAGVLLLWRRPFIVGDQIRVKEFEGTVEDISVRATRLKTYDGERVIIPNGDVYTSAVIVRTAYAKRRSRFIVGIGYLDDIERAREVLRDVLYKTEGVLGEPAPQILVTELAPSSVNFTVQYWTDSQRSSVVKVSDRVATGIKYALDKVGVDMPYPHTVVLFHDATGTRAGDIETNSRPSQALNQNVGEGKSEAV